MPTLLMGRGPGGQRAGGERVVHLSARDYAALLVWQFVRNGLYRAACFAERRIERRLRALGELASLSRYDAD